MPLSHPRRSALSEQVIAELRQQITSGEWPVGSRIPTEPELVEQLGVARNTVREAVRALAHNGLLDIRQGSGTYVVATSELAAQPVSFYAAVFFLVNATYIALIWELIETNPAADISSGARKAMRWRSIITLCLFGTASFVALLHPMIGLAICIGCLLVYLKPHPAWKRRSA